MSRVALLDVNVLVALFDADHVHHDIAHDWFADQRPNGWATCPLTENGFVRVLSHPLYASPAHRPADLLARLQKLRASGYHQFWSDAVSLCDKTLFRARFVAGPRHVTDAYLLGLALKRGGCLATFDRHIPLQAVLGAGTDALAVIAQT